MGAVSGWRTILRVDSSGCGASFEKIDSSGLPDGAGDDGAGDDGAGDDGVGDDGASDDSSSGGSGRGGAVVALLARIR